MSIILEPPLWIRWQFQMGNCCNLSEELDRELRPKSNSDYSWFLIVDGDFSCYLSYRSVEDRFIIKVKWGP